MRTDFIGDLNNAAEFIRPYIKNAGRYASDTAHSAGEYLNKKKRAAKRRSFIVKLSETVGLCANIVLLIAAFIALLNAVYEYIKKD